MYVVSKDRLEASLQSMVAVAIRHHFGEGYGPWAQADIEQYMRKQQRKTVRGFVSDLFGKNTPTAFLLIVVALTAATCVLLYMQTPLSPIPARFATAALFISMAGFGLYGVHMLLRGSRWMTNSFYPSENYYWRDYVRHPVPPQILSSAKTILDITGKDGTFLQVSFIGRDPVLWAYRHTERVAAIVWDENPDGSITIISPPKH